MLIENVSFSGFASPFFIAFSFALDYFPATLYNITFSILFNPFRCQNSTELLAVAYIYRLSYRDPGKYLSSLKYKFLS